MTFFQPNQKTAKFSVGFVLLVAAVITMALLSIYLYNGVVNIRHSMQSAEIGLQELETANADLKNELYRILDSENLQKLAGQLSLVKDNTPEYLETVWVFASQY